MNFISYTHAYALYPYVTFAEQQSVAILPNSRMSAYARDVLHRALTKYADRGWPTTLTPSITNALRSRSEFRDTARSVGDSACWVIPLTPVQHALSLRDFDSTVSVDPVRVNSWYVLLTESGQTRIGAQVLRLSAENPENEYSFTFAAVTESLAYGSTAEYPGEEPSKFTRQR